MYTLKRFREGLIRIVTGMILLSAGHLAGPASLWAGGPLRVDPQNPRYFTDDSGQAIYLTGSHTWCNFEDCGSTDPPPPFDFEAYLDFLQRHHHNFIRLWRAENAKGGEKGDDFWFAPMPYQRTGPGTALDGKPKFDLTRFNQAYFDRLRSRIISAGRRGIYVSVMLFDGWSIQSKLRGHNPWPGHPFNRNDNINRIDGDANGDGQGRETQTLEIPAVTALQENYVRKVVDTVNDLDNVLYEICNEGSSDSVAWQYHMINFIKAYEAGKPKQHPVGMTFIWPGGKNEQLFFSPADWISPTGDGDDPPVADGKKVILYDSDHLFADRGNPQWVWESLTRGCNPIFMDAYDKTFTGRGAPADYDPNNANDVAVRRLMGYALELAQRMNLTSMVPCAGPQTLIDRIMWRLGLPGKNIASSGYCLARDTEVDAEYLVYLPYGGVVRVNLANTRKQLNIEWFNADTLARHAGSQVVGGGIRKFRSPFGSTHALLHLYQTKNQ
jgi:Family of unknown function (DUF6298)